MKPKLSAPTLLLAFLFSVCLSGCFLNFYKTDSYVDKAQYPSTIQRALTDNRYFILHSGSQIYALSNIEVDQSKGELQMNLGSVDSSHFVYIKKPVSRTYKPKKGEGELITEIHLYANEGTSFKTGERYVLPLTSLNKIVVLQHDKSATTSNRILSYFGVTLGTLFVIGAIVAATKSSCPFVSGYDGTEVKLQGEIYGGSIYPSLQRHDYLPLHLQPVNGTLQVKISNELQEKQYTDLAELWSIQHDPGINIYPDETGNLYSVIAGVAPVQATAAGQDVVHLVSEKDDLYFGFDRQNTTGISSMEATFAKPAVVGKGKLILHLKNSYWLDYVYGELIKHMGGYFNRWTKLQEKKPAEQLLKWKDEQAIPLAIEMKTATGWQKVKTLTTVGPVAYRDMVVPIDLSQSATEVTFRLSCGFMFWELDQVSMDYSPAQNFAITRLLPQTATDELGKDVRAGLLTSDKNYLLQPVPGNVVNISYPVAPVAAGKAVTYILHTDGYYEHVRTFKGAPDVHFLNAFKQPQALPKYSAGQFIKLSSSLAKAN